jgi:two-component system sensor kinase FixL
VARRFLQPEQFAREMKVADLVPAVLGEARGAHDAPGTQTPRSVPDAMVVIDDRGLIRSCSQAAERLFGYTAGEVFSHNVSLLMPSPYREQHDGYITRYRTTGERRG